MNIIDAIDDKKLFAPYFEDRANWQAWRAFLCALFALPMSADELTIYRECTKRDTAPSKRFDEAWLVCGRRGGKSFTLALISVFLAVFIDWRPRLVPGERAHVVVIAADRKQARVILGYIKGLLTSVPMLAKKIQRETNEEVDLANSVTIEVATCSYRTIRGRTIVAALADEVAFWQSEGSANPDYEVLSAIRPAMATVRGAMLLCASSPYARAGALWDAHQDYFGRDDAPVLVWQAPTKRMNPTVDEAFIEKEYAKDPASAAAEYGALFRSDVERLLTREAVQGCVDAGVFERQPDRKISYAAFVDPSGGSADSFTLAIAHKEGKTNVLDLVRDRPPPFSPEAVVAEFAEILKKYRVTTVRGDRYAGDWPPEAFRKHGIHYEHSEKTKSDLFGAMVAGINSRAFGLLDNAKLISQFVGLERRTRSGGKDLIDHAPGGHDDLANAAAGALLSSDAAAPLNFGRKLEYAKATYV